MQYNVTYRQKNNGWQCIVSYKDTDGKWKQKSKQGFKGRYGKTKAQEYADDIVGELKKKVTPINKVDPGYEDITFKQFSDMFIEHEKLYKEQNTIDSYICAINSFKKLKELKIKDISPINIQKLVDELIKNKLKPITVKRYLTRINIMFKNAIFLNIITETPIKNISLPKKTASKPKTALTFEQQKCLLKKIKNKKKYIVTLIALKTGLRLGEILGLTWDNVDFKNKKIKVEKQWKRNKRNEKYKKYDFGTLKTINSKREVPMPDILITELKKFKYEYPTDITNRIFTGIINPPTFSTALHRYYKKMGFDITIHELRHTYATNLIASNVDFKTAAKFLGHDVKQTMEIYSHVTDDMVNRATEIIDTVLNF